MGNEVDKYKHRGYILQKRWFSFAINNPEKITPTQAALYWFCIEHCNSLGWPLKFGLPSSLAMAATGIKSYNTYIKSFRGLVEFGFIELIEKSKNQYTANIIALSKIDEPLDENTVALSNALSKIDEPMIVYKNNKTKTKLYTNTSIGETCVSQRVPDEKIISDFERDCKGSNTTQEPPVNISGFADEEKEKSSAKKEKAKTSDLSHENRGRGISDCFEGESLNTGLCGGKNDIKQARLPFAKPTLEEITAYCKERGNNVDPQSWIDHYTANGWKVGKNPMKDWKAAVRTWERNGIDRGNAGNYSGRGSSNEEKPPAKKYIGTL